jgi:acetyltransferase-like isoleucine patch superfamily enzyme
MTRPGALKRWLRPVGRPVKLAVHRLSLFRLRWLYLLDGIHGIEAELRRRSRDHAEALRRFGASVAPDVSIVGPVSIINAERDFSNLSIGSMAHIGSEAFIDLSSPVTIEAGATVSMRACLLTHFDAGHGPIAAARPPERAPILIAAGAYVGAGAIILHGVTIGREAIVAAGAVVRSDVADGTIVGGVPARELRGDTPTVIGAEQ